MMAVAVQIELGLSWRRRMRWASSGPSSGCQPDRHALSQEVTVVCQRLRVSVPRERVPGGEGLQLDEARVCVRSARES